MTRCLALALLAPTLALAAPPDFAAALSNKTLVGSFVIDNGPKSPAPLQTDSYRIGEVRKTGDDEYTVDARIKYGANDLTVPVPVTVRFAGDVPVLSLENLNIPLLGEGFGTKLVFDFEAGRYAGTWSHGDVGGTMWGRIEDAKPAAETPAE